MSAHELATPRLRLAPVREIDTDVLHAILIDESVRRFLCDGDIVPRAFAEDLVTKSLSSFEVYRTGLWLIYELPKSAAIGFCMLRSLGADPSPELLYALLPQSWGRGLAIEAADTVLRHAFDTLRCKDVFAEMDEPNTASIRVMEKLGMTFAGKRSGPKHTLLRYTLIGEDFIARGC